MSEAWLAACRALPSGHRHCRHGHVGDCPQASSCRLLPARDPVVMVQAGPTTWLFSNPRLAELQVMVLYHGGAKVAVTVHNSPDEARSALARLPEERRRTVEVVR